MNVIAQQANLKYALDMIGPAARHKDLVSLEMEGERVMLVTGQSNEMTIRTRVHVKADDTLSKPCSVAYSLALDIVGNMSADAMTIVSGKDGRVAFTQGKSASNLKEQDFIIAVPPMGEFDFALSGDTLQSVAQRVGVCANPKDGRDVLTGVHWRVDEETSMIEAAATDGFRLGIMRFPLTRKVGRPKQPYTCLMPVGALQHVGSRFADETSVDIKVTNKAVIFSNGVTVIAVQQIEFNVYPDYLSVVPTVFDTFFAVAADEITKTVKTVKPFAAEDSSVCGILVEPETPERGGWVSVRGDGDSGNAMRWIEGVAYVKGPKDKLDINLTYLNDVARVLRGQPIEFCLRGPAHPVVARIHGSDNYTHVIMPIRRGN